MEMKLNIYGKGGEVEKTYTSNSVKLKTGVCEDLLKIIDIDKMTDKNLSNEVLGVEMIKIVVKSYDIIKPLILDIFDGLTEEELRNTDVKEVAEVIKTAVVFTLNSLMGIGNNSKN